MICLTFVMASAATSLHGDKKRKLLSCFLSVFETLDFGVQN